jgi:YfiH family protein
MVPDWPAPAGIRAAFTTRAGGVSPPPFDTLNLGLRAGGGAEQVQRNRARLVNALNLPQPPSWLHQVHGAMAVCAEAVETDTTAADAVWTARHDLPCAVLVADCLPVLFCDDAGERVAAAHAGWRGLAGSVLEATVAALGRPGSRLMAWLGPAIGPEAFEVGGEVRDAFLHQDAGAGICFRPSPRGRWLADLPQLARRRLAAVGVERVYGGGWCTYSDPQRFFSYRRDGTTGRMAALVWRERQPAS